MHLRARQPDYPEGMPIPWKEELASLVATLPTFPLDRVAAYLEKTKPEIESALEEEAVKTNIARLQAEIELHAECVADKLTNIREKTAELLFARLDDKDDPIATKDLMALFKMSADYHPDKRYMKTERKEEVHNINIVRTHQLDRIKQQMIEARTRTPIGHEVVEGEYALIDATATPTQEEAA